MSFYRKTLCLVITLSLYVIVSYGQSHYTIDLPEGITPIDIRSLDGEYNHLITQDAIYEINGRSVELVTRFKEVNITKNIHRTYSLKNQNSYPSYPIVQGGFLSIIDSDSILVSHMVDIPHNIIRDEKSTLITLDKGRYEINNNEISHYKPNYDETQLLTEIDSIIEQYDISDVLYAYVSQDSSYRILTDVQCLTYRNNKISIDYTVDSTSNEELISISEDQMQNLWILSNTDIHIITPEYIKQYELPDSDKVYHIYQIRDNIYCSDGSQILQNKNKSWSHRKELIPVYNTSTDSSQNIYLIYQNKAILHDKNSAAVLQQIDGFPEEIITDINDRYISTTHNLYKDRVRISASQDHYYKTLQYEDKIIAMGQSGIYLYNDDNINLIYSMPLPYSKNYFVEDGIVYFFSENTIKHIEIDHPGIESDVPLMKTKVLDIMSADKYLIALTSHSLLYLPKKSLLRDRAIVHHAIPISPEIHKGQLRQIDGQTWITTNTSAISVDSLYQTTASLPSLLLTSDNKNDSLNASVRTNNFYGDNINYTYYINTADDHRMIWTRESHIELDYPSDTDIDLIAKMTDDVFVQDIYSNNVTISVKDSSAFDRLLKIIVAILATLLILWAIRWWIKP